MKAYNKEEAQKIFISEYEIREIKKSLTVKRYYDILFNYKFEHFQRLFYYPTIKALIQKLIYLEVIEEGSAEAFKRVLRDKRVEMFLDTNKKGISVIFQDVQKAL